MKFFYFLNDAHHPNWAPIYNSENWILKSPFINQQYFNLLEDTKGFYLIK